MGSANIQAKIKKGLAKAINKTGSASSELVYLVQETNTGGNTPIDPPVITKNNVLLKNAIFKNYDQSLIGGNIQAGDRQLVCDNVEVVSVGAIIKQGATNYIVMDLGEITPAGDVLVYMPQVRVQ